MAAEVGLADRFAIGYGAVAADFDNDGDEDLYVADGLKGIPMSMFGVHIPEMGVDIGGFLDPNGVGFPPVLQFDTPRGQLNGEFVVEIDPATERPRGQGRNSLYRNMLVETGKARFVDITDTAGDAGGTRDLPGGRHSATVSVADIDGDGRLDIFVGNFLDPDFWSFYRQLDENGRVVTDGSNLLFNGEKWNLLRNNGDMTFTEIRDAAGLLPEEPPFIFDFSGKKRNVYDPNLRDVAGKPVGENFPHVWASGFSDYDRDGDPDLWIAPDIPGHLHLFRNDTPRGGSVKFTDVSRLSGVALLGDWMSVSFGDFDEDLDIDVFTGNFGGSNYIKREGDDPRQQFVGGASEYNRWNRAGGQLNALFRNDGVRTATGKGAATTVPVMTNITGSVRVEYGLLPPLTADPAHVAPPKPALFGIEPYEFVWGSAAFDYDNDTHLDLYTLGSLGRGGDGGNGSLLHNPGRLLKGSGPAGWFRDVSVEAHALDISQVDYANVDRGQPPAPGDRIDLQLHENGKAVAIGDFNDDGFPDMFLTNVGGFDSNLPGATEVAPGMKAYVPGPAFLLINEGSRTHWLKVRLVGRTSNRNGIGAVLTVRFRENGKERQRMSEVIAGSGHQSMHSLVQHFGLRAAHAVDELRIRWPSGLVQTLRGIRANQTITVVEGESSTR